MAHFSVPQMLAFLLLGASLQISNSQNLPEFLENHDNKEKHWQLEQEELQEIYTTLKSMYSEEYHERLGNNISLSLECQESFEYIFSDISRLIPLLDALGKPGAGFLGGNNNLVGSFDECFNYNYTAFCYTSKLVTYIPVVVPWNAALCVPKYCTASDIASLINGTDVAIVFNTSLLCTNTKTPHYSPGAIAMLVVCAIFVALVLTGTVVDTLLQINIADIYSHSVNPDLNDKASESTPLLQEKPKAPTRVRPLDFLKAFSLFQTVPTLLATSQGSGVITCLNGIRVISMTWVILGHTYAFAMSFASVDNPYKVIATGSRMTFQAVGNAYFSVDSFFFLSGVLVAYLTLKEMKKKDGRFPFLHYYIHRYLRITPTYAFILFFASSLGIHLAVGPYMSLSDPLGPACSKYWWTNLFYINNLYPWKLGDECLGWGWYLANDMQFYVIAPLMLISAYFFLPAGAVIAGVLVLSGFTIDGVLTGVFDFQANEVSSLAYNVSSDQYNDFVYGKPWDRISPYVVGLAMGYIFYRKLKFNFGKGLNLVLYLLLWAVAAVVAYWLVYGFYFTWHGHIPTKAENVIYMMVSRCLWACCLGAVVFACHNGYGWVVNSFLSMKFWTPLARLTFNAYLVHPVIVFVIYGQLQKPIHYTDITLTCYFIAFVVLSYAAAAVVCVGVELPLGSIEMLLFKLVGLGRRESQRHNTVETKDPEA